MLRCWLNGLRLVPRLTREHHISLLSKPYRPQQETQRRPNGRTANRTNTCVPGLKRDDWPIRAPKGLLPDEVRAIRDEIKERVQSLVDGLSSKHGDSGFA
jgi:hypothetical protein